MESLEQNLIRITRWSPGQVEAGGRDWKTKSLSPPAELTRIVTEVERLLSVVEELEYVVAANVQWAVRLRQSILQKAFAGKLA